MSNINSDNEPKINVDDQNLNPSVEKRINSGSDSFDDGRFSGESRRTQNTSRFKLLAISFIVLFLVLFFGIKAAMNYYEAYQAQQKPPQVAPAPQKSSKTFSFNFPKAHPQFDKPEVAIPLLPDLPIAAPKPPPVVASKIAKPVVPPKPLMLASGKDSGERPARSLQELASSSDSPLTSTPQVKAGEIGDRSLLIARGAFIPCILQTQIDSTVPGQTTCVIPENIYADDGSRLLIPRGSQAVGQYGSGAKLKNGEARMAVLWDRIKTTDGLVVDVSSAAADGVGTAGVPGDVDNHWGDRIGAALLLSFISDGIDYEAQRLNSGSSSAGGVVVQAGPQPKNTVNTVGYIAQKVLDSTINIAPTLTLNRGTRLMIFVQKDLWFDDVYGK